MSNLVNQDPKLVNRTSFDYRLTQTSLLAINAGVNPGVASNGFSLTPVWQYVHPANKEPRALAGTAIDIGAYEYGGSDTVPPAAPKNLKVK